MNNNLPVTLYGGKDCIPFYRFINNIKKFFIPPYQRQYVGRIEKAKELGVSILKKCKNNKFLGLGVILGSKRDGESFEIIDGQQRILTFLLMWSCLYPDDPLWQELDFRHDHLINNDSDVSKKSIFTIEVIRYLLNPYIKKANNYSPLNKIIKYFKESVSKSKENPKNHEVLLDFIKNSLLITVLYTVIDGYPFFEIINSGVPLSLYERCFAFIAYNDGEHIKAKQGYFQKLENSSYSEKKKFINFFIKIFSFQQNIEPFEQFKKIYKEDDRKDCFFSFLEEYIKQKTKKEGYFKSVKAIPNFCKYYGYIIAWDNYWPVIVLLYFKKIDEEFIEEKFFRVLGILDLHLNLKKVKKLQAETNISCAKKIYNRGHFLTKEEISRILNHFGLEKSSIS